MGAGGSGVKGRGVLLGTTTGWVGEGGIAVGLGGIGVGVIVAVG